MGLLSILRRRDERAIPEPGTPEFEAMVEGTAIPDSLSVRMGESGWASTSSLTPEAQTIDLRDTGAREKVEDALRRHGIDPDEKGQVVDASTVPGLRQAILEALGIPGLSRPPGS
jgi:hypothetical protein